MPTQLSVQRPGGTGDQRAQLRPGVRTLRLLQLGMCAPVIPLPAQGHRAVPAVDRADRGWQRPPTRRRAERRIDQCRRACTRTVESHPTTLRLQHSPNRWARRPLVSKKLNSRSRTSTTARRFERNNSPDNYLRVIRKKRPAVHPSAGTSSRRDLEYRSTCINSTNSDISGRPAPIVGFAAEYGRSTRRSPARNVSSPHFRQDPTIDANSAAALT